MAELFARFGADLPPLHGIYLAAFGGGPVTLADMTDADVTAMFAPKLDALAVVHPLSVEHPVRQFVLFSSISGLTGSRWLAHYTATSTFLDTFAHARRAAGLPVTTVNWGLWKSLSNNQSEQEAQVSIDSGLMPMADDVAIAALRWVGGAGAPVRSVVVEADWPLLATAYRTRAALHIVDDLLDAAPAAGAGGGLGQHEVPFGVGRRGADRAAGDPGCPYRTGFRGDGAGPLAGAGADGRILPVRHGLLMSVTLQRSLSGSLGEQLPTSVIFDYPSVEALTGYLSGVLPELVEASRPTMPTSTTTSVTTSCWRSSRKG
jgi:phthiocerol/phenolphthiocerol synthesis type-I polyketide synthase B